MDTSLSKLWEMVKDREALHSTFHRVAKNWTQLSKWTTTSHFTDEIKVEFLSSLRNFNCWYISSIVALQTEWSCQSHPILCDPMDYSLPGSSVHGIFQARILEWVTISFSRRSSPPRDWTWVSQIVGRPFTIWATRASLIVQLLKNLPAIHETPVQFLRWDDPLEKG